MDTLSAILLFGLFGLLLFGISYMCEHATTKWLPLPDPYNPDNFNADFRAWERELENA